jgi:hypothetical protein
MIAQLDNIMVGDRVRWESAAGTIRGEILEIRLAQNANNELIPWLIIEFYNNNKACKIMLCGTDSYLKMMKFQVNFRDVEKQQVAF